MQTRKQFIKSIGIGAAALGMPGIFYGKGSEAKKPNILFIMSDDHAEQAISCYGSKLINTPNIDRIAETGIRFQNSFVTNSICGPSRAAMLTGKYSHKNGLRDNRDTFDGNQVTYPKLLQKAGYVTSIVGKWHLKSEPTGFDKWKILIGQGQYYNPVFKSVSGEEQITGYTTDLITDEAIDMLNSRDRNRPFCMLVHHKAPHRNWMPSPKYMRKFKDKPVPEPETLFDDYQGRNAAGAADMRIDDMYLSTDFKLNEGTYEKETGSGGNLNYAEKVEESWRNTYNRMTDEQKKQWDEYYDEINEEYKKAGLKGKDLLKWKYQRYMQDYLACVLSVDESVGRLLDYLEQNNLKDDTIVVYTSDQGFYLGEHGWYDKRFMYEESLGMPLVMSYPGEIEAGQVSNDMVMNLDFAATFLDYAGVEIPAEIQGESFREIARGNKPADWRTAIYYHYYEYPHGWHDVKRHYGIRTGRYKLIHFYNDIDVWELYDLREDPNEMNNLYGDSRYSEIISELKKELESLRFKYGDTEPVE